ncbi:MAG: nuclear transport factor 2 family protein [Verrucomicrobia bacterium]|nr:nuclear transport factor 2 family protein [Verrucomicrobiota bacterium]
MKIIISLFASAFVAIMAIAQEESASPAETTAPSTEEKASATVESTPATAPAEAQKKEETLSAAPATAATAPKKEASTAGKPVAASTAAASKAAAPAKNMSVKDMENAWEAAVGKHDAASIDGFVAADFVGVSAKNKFTDRADVIGEFKKDKDTYKSAKNEKLNVKMFGTNVAVVTGRAREVGTGKDGKAFDRTFLFTDTWMMRGGKWQCVASQVAKIKG